MQKIGGSEQLENLIRLMVAHNEQDGLIGGAAMARIDVACELGGLGLQRAVGRRLGPRRRGDLHEDKPVFPFRVAGQERFDSAQPIEDALGVVEALDADREPHVVAKPETPANRRPALRHGF